MIPTEKQIRAAQRALEEAQNARCGDYGCDGLNVLGSPCAGQCNRLWHVESCRRRQAKLMAGRAAVEELDEAAD